MTVSIEQLSHVTFFWDSKCKMNLSKNIELSPNSNVMLKNVSVCNRIVVMTGNKQAYSAKTTMLLASEKLYLVSRLLYYGDEVSLKQTYYGI